MAAGSESGMCGEPGRHGWACGLVSLHEGDHFPVRVCELNSTPAKRRRELSGADDGWERGRDAYHVTFPQSAPELEAGPLENRTAESDREAG
jgi:hypothetical protein